MTRFRVWEGVKLFTREKEGGLKEKLEIGGREKRDKFRGEIGNHQEEKNKPSAGVKGATGKPKKGERGPGYRIIGGANQHWEKEAKERAVRERRKKQVEQKRYTPGIPGGGARALGSLQKAA